MQRHGWIAHEKEFLVVFPVPLQFIAEQPDGGPVNDHSAERVSVEEALVGPQVQGSVVILIDLSRRGNDGNCAPVRLIHQYLASGLPFGIIELGEVTGRKEKETETVRILQLRNRRGNVENILMCPERRVSVSRIVDDKGTLIDLVDDRLVGPRLPPPLGGIHRRVFRNVDFLLFELVGRAGRLRHGLRIVAVDGAIPRRVAKLRGPGIVGDVQNPHLPIVLRGALFVPCQLVDKCFRFSRSPGRDPSHHKREGGSCAKLREEIVRRIAVHDILRFERLPCRDLTGCGAEKPLVVVRSFPQHQHELGGDRPGVVGVLQEIPDCGDIGEPAAELIIDRSHIRHGGSQAAVRGIFPVCLQPIGCGAELGTRNDDEICAVRLPMQILVGDLRCRNGVPPRIPRHRPIDRRAPGRFRRAEQIGACDAIDAFHVGERCHIEDHGGGRELPQRVLHDGRGIGCPEAERVIHPPERPRIDDLDPIHKSNCCDA